MSKTTTLNLAVERAVLDKTLFRANELIREGSDPYNVLRVFTKLFLNARGVSKETLDSDRATLKAIFKASGGTKAVAGAGFEVDGSVSRARRGAAAYSPSSPNYGYMSTLPSPPPPPFGMRYTAADGWGASPAQQPPNVRGIAREGAQRPRASRRGKAWRSGRGWGPRGRRRSQPTRFPSYSFGPPVGPSDCRAGRL